MALQEASEAYLVGLFEDTIARITVLAVFLPVLAGQSGNTGCQAMAVALRGMTLGELKPGVVTATLAALARFAGTARVTAISRLPPVRRSAPPAAAAPLPPLLLVDRA